MTSAAPSPRWLSRRSVVLWILLGLLVLVLAVTAAAPQSFPAGSSYEQSLRGYAQWYAYMEQQKHPIRRWRKDYSQLRGRGQTLLQVADVERSQEANLWNVEVDRWVEAGNTLIQLAWDGEITGAPFRSDFPTTEGGVRIETTRRFRLYSPDTTWGGLKDSFGAVVIAEPRGKGQIVKCVSPWLGSGAYASQPGNFAVLAKLVTQEPGTVWVDEWLHGYRDANTDSQSKQERGSLWGYFSRRPVAVLAGQGALLLLLALWGQNQRFGTPQRVIPPSRNSSEQYIQALADTLYASRHGEYVLKLLGQSFRDTLRSRLGMAGMESSAETDRVIATEWASVTGRPSSELLELLKQADRPTQIQDHDLVAWARQTTTLLRELP